MLPHLIEPVPARVEFCARSDIGLVRARNEDTLEIRSDQAWAVLADGMGGYRGGDVASRIAVSAVMQRLDQEARAGRTGSPVPIADALRRAVWHAHDEVRRVAMSTRELSCMATTIVIATFHAGCVVSAHVGDSRLYRMRDGALLQLTRDHSMLQEIADGGIMDATEAVPMQFRKMLTRGVGVGAAVVPEISVHPARRGDIFMLCSDGLTDMLDDDVIGRVIGGIGAADGELAGAADALVELANAGGGRDNISVILARVLA